jgi:hypothetical protein
VKQWFAQYALVQLYTDTVPRRFYPANERSAVTPDRQSADAQTHLVLQREKFQTEQLPLYVILEPQEGGGYKEVARYTEGKINDVAGFVQFLKDNVGGPAKVASQTGGN